MIPSFPRSVELRFPKCAGRREPWARKMVKALLYLISRYGPQINYADIMKNQIIKNLRTEQ